MACRVDRDIRGDEGMRSDGHLAHIEDGEIEIGVEIVPDRDIAAIIAMERRLKPRPFPDAAEQLSQQLRDTRRLIVRFHGVEFEQFALARLMFLGQPVKPRLVRQTGQHSLLLIHIVSIPLATPAAASVSIAILTAQHAGASAGHDRLTDGKHQGK